MALRPCPRLLAALLVPLATVLVAAEGAQAAAVTSDFEDLADRTALADQYLDSAGVFFREEASVVPEVRDVGSAVAHSGTNVVDLSNCSGSGGGCEFFTPVAVGRLTDSARTVSAYVGFRGNTGFPPQTVTLSALDSAGNELDSESVSVSAGAPFDTEISVTTPSALADIASFRIYGGLQSNAAVGFDDLTIVRDDAPSPPDFGLTPGSRLIRLRQGDFVDLPISVDRVNGSEGEVALDVSGLPDGVSAEFSPNPVPGTIGEATMKVTASESAPLSEGRTDLEITGTPSPGAGSEPRSTSTSVVVIENCARRVIAPYIDARSEDCMRRQGPHRFTASDSIRVNGLRFTPLATGARLTVDRQRRTLSSEGYPFAVSVADLPGLLTYAGPIDWDLGGDGEKPKQVIDLKPSEVPKLKGLPVSQIKVALTRGGDAQVAPTVKLGFWPFNYFGALTAKTGFKTDNDRGSDLSSLAVKLDRLVALGLELKKVDVRWKQGGTWSGQATAKLMFARNYSIGAGFGIKQGRFDFLKGSVGGINVPVGPGVFMQKLGFEVARNPFALTGTVGLSAGPSLGGEKAVTIDGALKAVLDDPFVVEVKGGAKLADRFKLADALVRYSSNGTFTVGGKAIWDLKVAKVTGKVDGFVDGFRAASLEGSAKGCIKVRFFPDPCAGAAVIASNIGIAACVDLVVVSGGIGYYWSGKADLFGGSCDLGPWRPSTSSATTAANGAGRFKLEDGLPGYALAVDGVGAAPDATLSGPGGVALSVSSQQPFTQTDSGVGVLGVDGTTYFYVKRPRGGNWILREGDGASIRTVRESFGLPQPKVRANVRGRVGAARRTVRWRLRRIPGQRVRFVEVGPGVRNVIKTTRKARGNARFRPTAAPARKRRIVAYVEQNGAPRETVKVAGFRTRAGQAPRTRGLRLKRRKSGLRVGWRRGGQRLRHAVHVNLSDGRKLLRIAGPRRSSIRIPGAGRAGAKVTVAALTSANGRGPAATARLRPAAPSRPKAGRWRLKDGFGFTSGGRMKLARSGRLLKKLVVTPGATAASSCGKRLRVKGKLRIKRMRVAGASFWGFGKRQAKGPNGLAPAPVKVKRGRRKLDGSLELRFSGPRRGEAELQGGDCRLVFDLRR